MKHPFVTNPTLTAMVMGYRNQANIADGVLPRVTVPGEQFRYTEYGMEDFNIVDDLVGRTGRVNELEFEGTQKDSSVVDRGLESPIPQSDIDAAARQSNFDPKANASMKLVKIIDLAREKRVSDLVFNAATYAAANKTQLVGTAQWNDRTNSTPIDDIMDAKDTMLIVPNKLVLGRQVYSQLIRHPTIVKAIHGNSGDEGIVSRQALAELLEFQEILVGQAWANGAKKGQTKSMGRLWGKHASMIYVENNPTDPDEITFGMTPQYLGRVSQEYVDGNIGLRGGVRIRVGESTNELVTAADVGFFFEDAVA